MIMRQKYGVSIIGCGHMGESHISDIFDDADFTMVCACDSDISRTEKFGKHYGFRRTTSSPEKCINDKEADIIIIATYPSTHIQLLKQCFEAGKHVLCEKPVCTNKEELKIYSGLIKAYPDCKVLISLILRHNRSYNRVAEMIQNGAIGFPVVFRMVQNHHTMNWPRYRRLICETSPIVDCGVHYLDVMQWFTSAKITKIEGICQRTEQDLPEDRYNYGMITVTMSDGSVGYYEAGWGNNISAENVKEFIGPLGRIRLVLKDDRTNHREEGDLIEFYEKNTKEYKNININGKYKPTGDQLKYLVRMIEDDLPSVPAHEDMAEVFDMLLDTDEKLKEGLREKERKHECIGF